MRYGTHVSLNLDRPSDHSDLGVRRACLCVVWVKYIDLVT